MLSRPSWYGKAAFVSLAALFLFGAITALLALALPREVGRQLFPWSLFFASATALFLLFRRLPSPAPLATVPLPRRPRSSGGVDEVERRVAELEKMLQSGSEKEKRLEQSLADCLEKQSELIVELNKKNDDIQRFSKERQEKSEREHSLEHSLKLCEEELAQKRLLNEEYQQTIRSQRETLQRQEQQIHQLQGKVRDLSYEIKTLLLLTGSGQGYHTSREELSSAELVRAPVKPVSSPGEAALLVRKWVESAEAMPVAPHLSGMGASFGELSAEGNALDLRRLFEAMRGEEEGVLFLYSPHEEKFLFIHPEIKKLVGWSEGKVMASFPDLICGGWKGWKRATTALKRGQSEEHILHWRTSTGEELALHSCLSPIERGIFRGQILGVFYGGQEAK